MYETLSPDKWVMRLQDVWEHDTVLEFENFKGFQQLIWVLIARVSMLHVEEDELGKYGPTADGEIVPN